MPQTLVKSHKGQGHIYASNISVKAMFIGQGQIHASNFSLKVMFTDQGHVHISNVNVKAKFKDHGQKHAISIIVNLRSCLNVMNIIVPKSHVVLVVSTTFNFSSAK